MHRPPMWGTMASSPPTAPPISHAALHMELHSSRRSVTSVRRSFCNRQYIDRGKREVMYLLYVRCFLSQMPSTCTGRTMPRQMRNELYLQMVQTHTWERGAKARNNKRSHPAERARRPELWHMTRTSYLSTHGMSCCWCSATSMAHCSPVIGFNM